MSHLNDVVKKEIKRYVILAESRPKTCKGILRVARHEGDESDIRIAFAEVTNLMLLTGVAAV